jgi:hypothetical protein
MLIGTVVGLTAGKADPPDPSAVNPYTQVDPDGVPLAVTQPNQKQLSPEEIGELREAQAQAARDKNWLLRSYEQQLQKNVSNSTQEPNANLYFQLSSNKDLAKLAGLPDLDPEKGDGTLSYRVPSGPGPAPLPSDASSTPREAPLSHGNFFKPLVTPLSAPDAAGLHNFYSFLPAPAVEPFYGRLPQKSAVPAAPSEDSFSDLETPGLIAAKNNPLADPDVSDLNLEVLPGESIEQARAEQENNNNLQLPLALDADQLHREQAGALNVPSPPKIAQTPAKSPEPVKTVPTQDPDAPIPVSQVPQISPVRPPIANPFDILNR